MTNSSPVAPTTPSSSTPPGCQDRRRPLPRLRPPPRCSPRAAPTPSARPRRRPCPITARLARSRPPPPPTPSSSPAPIVAVAVAPARRRRRCGEAPRRLPRPVHPRGRSSAAAPIPAGDLDPSPRCEPLPPPLSFSLPSPHAIRKRAPPPTIVAVADHRPIFHFFVTMYVCMYVHCIMLCICCIMLVFAFFCYQEKGLFFGDMYVHMLINI